MSYFVRKVSKALSREMNVYIVSWRLCACLSIGRFRKSHLIYLHQLIIPTTYTNLEDYLKIQIS